MFYERVPLPTVTLLSCHASIPSRRVKQRAVLYFESGNAGYLGRRTNFRPHFPPYRVYRVRWTTHGGGQGFRLRRAGPTPSKVLTKTVKKIVSWVGYRCTRGPYLVCWEREVFVVSNRAPCQSTALIHEFCFRGGISTIDTRTAQITNTRLAAHEWVSRYQNASEEH